MASLHLDAKNPRIGRETSARAPREIIQYLFDHDKALDIAESIASRGYFPNEPLLAVKENDQYVIVEGNRRLAALKALREPGLLDGSERHQVERLSRQSNAAEEFTMVPVTIASSRRATDRQIVGRHIGSPVLAWQAENRASFILDKLAEGYTNDELRDDLGFTLADIQQARQTRAIADMARSLDLSDEVKAKLDSPRAKIFTTLERVFDSSVGREYLKVQPDPEHGLRGNTTKSEFIRGLKKLVTDVAIGKQSSRTLNTNDNIRDYFESWDPQERPASKRGTFVPSDIIQGRSVASEKTKLEKSKPPKPSRQQFKTVLPRNLKVRFGSDRLIDIHRELIRLKREDYPNAGAVLLRVFFELAIRDYLGRIGELKKLTEKLKTKGKLPPHGEPTISQLIQDIIRIVQSKLSAPKAEGVVKAIKFDPTAPFSYNDLNGFVHRASELPGERDILQFWLRTEPLFRMMLERDPEESKE